ncbi:unnamed protein product [Prorocentrum cordatum]|uniref:EF-hand domain-containing protein n=1 Tax=Prorocentrum cordatum TaxID=2364126 RepID=A0ABN9UGI1_9DINO|nr:unnamed protein product [Polarella glacialis]
MGPGPALEQEQEQEQEKEMMAEKEVERTPEEAAERNYSREDEAARPWPLASLAVPPELEKKGVFYRALAKTSASASTPAPPFYPLADFTVSKGILGRTQAPLSELPGFVMVSENYYRKSWRFTSVRRLKNVICFLEWVPTAEQLEIVRLEAQLTEEQEAIVEDVFNLHDPDKTGFVQGQLLDMLLSALLIGQDGEALAVQQYGGRWSLADLKAEIASQGIYRLQKGRFFVVLSLQEAEHLRAAMHLAPDARFAGEGVLEGISSDQAAIPLGCGLALRCLGNLESVLDSSLVDTRGPVARKDKVACQLKMAEQCLRFTNSSTDYEEEELCILLRALRHTAVMDRKPWWSDVRSCRRRAQVQVARLPIAQTFSKVDEFEKLATQAPGSGFPPRERGPAVLVTGIPHPCYAPPARASWRGGSAG